MYTNLLNTCCSIFGALNYFARKISYNFKVKRTLFIAENKFVQIAKWLSLEKKGRQMPKIFHVNWFRKSNDGLGKFMWPGFGENIRVLEW